MRIIFTSQAAELDDAGRALLDLVRDVWSATVPMLVLPEGALAEAARGRGMLVVTVSGFRTAQAAEELPQVAASFEQAVAPLGADLIHAHGTLAGLVVTAASMRGSLPPFVIGLSPGVALDEPGVTALRMVSPKAAAIVATSPGLAEAVAGAVEGAPVEEAASGEDLLEVYRRVVGGRGARATSGA